jgi:undecaprenyl pyrophosphate phosphatase UppP
MVIDTGTMAGIIIALAGSMAVMILFWKENIQLQKKVRNLQLALRDERRNK